MKRITIDVKTCHIDPDGEMAEGLRGQISWHRLQQLFRQTGEIAVNEEITHFQITDNFLIFRVG